MCLDFLGYYPMKISCSRSKETRSRKNTYAIDLKFSDGSSAAIRCSNELKEKVRDFWVIPHSGDKRQSFHISNSSAEQPLRTMLKQFIRSIETDTPMNNLRLANDVTNVLERCEKLL